MCVCCVNVIKNVCVYVGMLSLATISWSIHLALRCNAHWGGFLFRLVLRFEHNVLPRKFALKVLVFFF